MRTSLFLQTWQIATPGGEELGRALEGPQAGWDPWDFPALELEFPSLPWASPWLLQWAGQTAVVRKILHIAVLASHRKENNPQKVHKLLTAKIKTLFSTWKRQGVMATSYSWGIFQLATRGTFFTMSTISLWNNLHREMVDSATSDTSKIQLGHFFQSCFAKKVWTRWSLRSHILWSWVCDLPLKVAEAGRLHSSPNTWLWYLLWFSFAKHGNFGLGGKTDFHSQGWHFSLLCSKAFQGWAKRIGGKSGLTSPCIICS